MKMAERVDALARALEVPLAPEARNRLVSFAGLVETWNARLDLTAAREGAGLAEVLFADALVMSDRRFVPEGATLLDVGSGGGGPAFSFALLRPDVHVVMVEPLRKRVAFLRTAIGSLGVQARVRAVEGRVEPGEPRPETADVASARATFSPEVWQRAGLVLSPACLVFSVGATPPPPGARLAHERAYALPFSLAPRTLARLERG